MLPDYPFTGRPTVPRLGLGTWHMGEDPARRHDEVAALRRGLDLGMTLVDTAEMYGEGGAEQVVGEAIRGRRDEVFLVSKFYPHHADRRGLAEACDRSLARLGVEAIDLYLLHWRSQVPFAETLEGLERLTAQGKIVRWGVSNLDVDDLEAIGRETAGALPAANQVYYNLARRGIEFDLVPWCRSRGVPLMAYSPLDEGRLAAHAGLGQIARRLSATPAQVAIAWLLRHPDVLVIPKAARPSHVEQNRAAVDLRLDAEVIAGLEALFPAPRRKTPLAIA